ncbi:MAG TPA: M14 family zinc carboxypeptidase [Vicinamibacterales bacterium]|nr:M14 family zinc carboxypeptidase [Vicinamibacterales bacterium]
MRNFVVGAALMCAVVSVPAQQMVTETRDPAQTQDADFEKSVKEWTTQPYYSSPLVDHLPIVKGVPTPKSVLGYHIGAPYKLTYYADILKYYRALAAATPRVKIETIGKSDEGRELVVVWVSSDENIKNLQKNRDNLAKIADPRGLSEPEIRQLIATTKPHYHFMGGLHSGETGPSEMLMELCYRLATETSPLIRQIRDNVIVSITPVADPDGRDRNVDWFYSEQERLPAAAVSGTTTAQGPGGAPPAGGAAQAAPGGGRGGAQLPYWGKYVFHDNNRDINLSQIAMRALVDWYFTAHPPIMHDLHEAQPLLYTYSGGPPQNPNLDPILFAELPFFSNFELEQMTKYGMPGVYTHAFMDGWSPGYLGSVAYNHNGMMRMYETQSGRENGPGRGQTSAAAPAPATPAIAAPTVITAPLTTSPQPAADAPQAARGGGRGGRAGGGRGGGAAPGAEGAQTPQAGRGEGAAFGGGRAGGSTGRGGGQPREWYRGLPIPPDALTNFSRRNNTNYMETGVLSGLQLTSMFPNLVLENFYKKTQHSIDAGKTEAPYGYIIPAGTKDMTRAVTLVNILRAQQIEIGQAKAEIKIADTAYPAGSYVIKRDQPYGKLAKNLLEKQNYPDPNLTTYDDSGWTMGLAMGVEVKEIKDKAILDVPVTPVKEAVAKGKVVGGGSAGLAVAHYGSNNMIAFRYALKTVPMKIADKSFSADGLEFPAGSFVMAAGSDMGAVKAAVEKFGLTAASLSAMPAVGMHDADPPRVAIYSSWNNTQEIGWYRYTFDRFGIPFDLIFKERVRKGNLRADYDVIVMPTQQANRQAVFAPPAARPVPYLKSEKYKFLGMYGESPDITGGMGGEGVDAFAKFLESGGTLICTGDAVRFPTELGFARTVDASGNTTGAFYAPRPLINAELVKPEHPVFYGYTDHIIAVKYLGGPLMTVGQPDQGAVLARYPGGDSNVLSGLMRGADEITGRPFAIDVPGGYTGKGRVVLFSNNPIYRWQNHAEFNMVFNAIMNWNDLGGPAPSARTTTAGGGR